MTSRKNIPLLMIAALCVALCGCVPSSDGPADELNESFFRMGKARANALDQKGAIEAFEKAIDVNPQNGSAHFELGLLCEKEADFSAAIYHFERFLKLRPDSEMAETVRAMISADKMELSKSVASTPVNQTELARLTSENKRLQTEIDRLNAVIAQATVQSQSTPTVRQGESGGGSTTRSGAGSTGGTTTAGSRPGASSGASSSITLPVARPMRTHIVKAGDTPVSISRQYGIKLDALMAANRGLDPRRMKVGQVVTLPPR